MSSVEQSDQITELFAALLAFSAEVEQPVKNAVNQHFGNSFADLRTVLAAVKPTLQRHGLVIVQLPATTEKGVGLCTQITHAPSGQWIRATASYPVQQASPQAAASAITYARRYGIMAALGIAAEDDDGEAAMGRDTRIDRRPVTRDGSPVFDMEQPAPSRAMPDDQRMNRSKARAQVRAANANAGGMRTMDDIAGAPQRAPEPARASVHPLRKARPNPAIPNAGRPVPNPGVVLAYNEMANTIHAMTPVKLTGELDQFGMLVPPGECPKFASGPDQGKRYHEVPIDTIRGMGLASSFLSSAPPINKLWAAYIVARIDAQVRIAK